MFTRLRLSVTRSVPGFDCTNALQQCIALLHILAIIGGAEAAAGFVLMFAAGRAPPLWLRSSLTRSVPGFNRAGALERVHDFCGVHEKFAERSAENDTHVLFFTSCPY